MKSIDANSTFSIGVDIETGGHVFQIMATNSVGMVEQFYVPKTTDRWLKGDIHLGFNINRMFTLADYDKMKKNKEKRKLKKEREAQWKKASQTWEAFFRYGVLGIKV